jgi:hypothetical protein
MKNVFFIKKHFSIFFLFWVKNTFLVTIFFYISSGKRRIMQRCTILQPLLNKEAL